MSWTKPNWSVHPKVQCLITDRHEGFSSPPYDSLNFGTHVGDDPLCVQKNRALLRNYLPSEPLWLNQVHGCRVLDADLPLSHDLSYDAAITTTPGRVLVIMSADCLPVFFSDNQARIVGIAHAGWRGLVAGVLRHTVHAMHDKLGQKSQLQAYLGPCIGPTAFEVGSEVFQVYRELLGDAVEPAFKPLVGSKFLANLPLLAQIILEREGVEQVTHSQQCTYSQTDFFSYRRDGQTGRMANLIWLG